MCASTGRVPNDVRVRAPDAASQQRAHPVLRTPRDVRLHQIGPALSAGPVSLDEVTTRLTDPEQLKELLGIPFTPEQTACITAPPAPQVIVAGAGSGKTTVMAARVVWLVGTGQVAPEQVLGLTFTNKAAGELAERVRKALIKAGVTDPDAIDPDNPRASP